MVAGKKIKVIAQQIVEKVSSFDAAKLWVRGHYSGSKKELNLLAKLVLRNSKK